MKFQLHSFCFSFLQCLMIVSNSRKTKTIVILFGLRFEKAWFWSNWSKWSKSQPHLQNMFWICFISSSWFEDCWNREMWKEVWNLLVRNNWWNSRKQEWMKSVIFRMCQTGWNSLAIGLAEWLKLVAIKQTTISTTTELDFLLLLSESDRNAVFSSFHPNFSTFFEWLFREQEHLKRENGNEMEKYLLLAN